MNIAFGWLGGFAIGFYGLRFTQDDPKGGIAGPLWGWRIELGVAWILIDLN